MVVVVLVVVVVVVGGVAVVVVCEGVVPAVFNAAGYDVLVRVERVLVASVLPLGSGVLVGVCLSLGDVPETVTGFSASFVVKVVDSVDS